MGSKTAARRRNRNPMAWRVRHAAFVSPDGSYRRSGAMALRIPTFCPGSRPGMVARMVLNVRYTLSLLRIQSEQWNLWTRALSRRQSTNSKELHERVHDHAFGYGTASQRI